MIDEDTKIDKEGMDNLVAVFSLLLKWDRQQNPENYKRKNDEPWVVDSKDGKILL